MIAVAGIGSMLALSVRQRVREIGIRMALARRRGISCALWFARACCWWRWPGRRAGGAVALTGALKAVLFEVKPTDLPTYLIVSALLFGAALLAA